jgi:hypothetical protein
MQWMTSEGWTLAYGSEHGYLVALGETEVRLSRFSIPEAESGLAAKLALGVMRTVIVFPLGRGPGRPGGVPELAALAVSAKGYAERYEAGESLPGYPAWQHAAPPDGLIGVDGHVKRGHSADGPQGCRRCGLLRANQGWMSS